MVVTTVQKSKKRYLSALALGLLMLLMPLQANGMVGQLARTAARAISRHSRTALRFRSNTFQKIFAPAAATRGFSSSQYSCMNATRPSAEGMEIATFDPEQEMQEQIDTIATEAQENPEVNQQMIDSNLEQVIDQHGTMLKENLEFDSSSRLAFEKKIQNFLAPTSIQDLAYEFLSVMTIGSTQKAIEERFWYLTRKRFCPMKVFENAFKDDNTRARWKSHAGILFAEGMNFEDPLTVAILAHEVGHERQNTHPKGISLRSSSSNRVFTCSLRGIMEYPEEYDAERSGIYALYYTGKYSELQSRLEDQLSGPRRDEYPLAPFLSIASLPRLCAAIDEIMDLSQKNQNDVRLQAILKNLRSKFPIFSQWLLPRDDLTTPSWDQQFEKWKTIEQAERERGKPALSTAKDIDVWMAEHNLWMAQHQKLVAEHEARSAKRKADSEKSSAELEARMAQIQADSEKSSAEHEAWMAWFPDLENQKEYVALLEQIQADHEARMTQIETNLEAQVAQIQAEYEAQVAQIEQAI